MSGSKTLQNQRIHMKKILLALGLSLSAFTYAATENQKPEPVTPAEFTQYFKEQIALNTIWVSSFTNNIASLKYSPLDLPFWAVARIVGVTSGLTICGNLVGVGLRVLVGNKDTVDMLNISQNHWFTQTATAAGLATGIYAAHKLEIPSGIAKSLNQPLIAYVLAASDKYPEALMPFMQSLFATSQFPRMQAFIEIQKVIGQLERIEKIIENTKVKLFGNRKGKRFNQTQNKLLVEKITFVKKALNNGLITLKNDPQWLQECSAYSMQQAGQAAQRSNDQQLAASVINIAHAYSKSN